MGVHFKRLQKRFTKEIFFGFLICFPLKLFRTLHQISYCLLFVLGSNQKSLILTRLLLKFAEIVLKNNIFQFNEKTLKQLRGTVIGSTFAPPYAIIFMTATHMMEVY